MSADVVVEVVGQVIRWTAICVAPFVNLYPLLYAFRPWRSTRQGEALMVKGVGNLVLVDTMLVAILFRDDWWWLLIVYAAGFVIFSVGIVYLFVTLLTAPGARQYPPFRWRRAR